MPHLIAAFDLVATLMVIVGLGGLIFFHELGHFLACRLTGTRVETFSIGFGPKLWGWRRGNTLYKIGAIPLGGYVKMAAENPGDVSTGAPDEFTSKSYVQRMFIMSAGVIFNIILAVTLYVWAFWIGVPFMSTQVGYVQRGSPAWEAGLQRGDLVTQVDGSGVQSFMDLRQEVAFSTEGQELSLTVVRDGKTLTLPVRPRYSDSEGMPIVGLQPMREIAGVQEGSPIAKAGGRVQDTVLAVGGKPVDGPREFVARMLRSLEDIPDDAQTALFQVLVRRQDGSEETLQLVQPVKWEPRIGLRPVYERPRILGVRPGILPAGLIRADELLVSVNGTAVKELGLLRRRALDADEPVREFVVRRDG
ncbi:MAG: RIP metalloprotease RseP, partial [Planctomycetota bacterium]|nr:RIP metalloprotease RseP [Planctomycetota bacterium]